MPKRRSSGTQANAGLVAGAGGGTLLVLVANILRSDNPLRPVLLYVAPTFSVFSSALLVWMHRATTEYLDSRAMEINYQRAKKTIERVLANPNTSEEHKASLRRKIEQAETAMADNQLERLVKR